MCTEGGPAWGFIMSFQAASACGPALICLCPSLGNKEDEFRMPYLSHQQLPAGILPMVPEVAQAVGVSQGHHTKDFTRAAPNPAKATVTAMIARELLYGGTSPTAETILKNNISSGHVPHGPLTRPSEQLDYLSRVQGFQVTARPELCGLYLRAVVFGFLPENEVCSLLFKSGSSSRGGEWRKHALEEG